MTLKIMFVDDAARQGDLAAQELLPPKRGSAEAAGLDLVASNVEPIVLAAGTQQMIPTGIAMALPVGYEGQVRPRSGLAAKHGLTVLNSPGTIDSDYRGEVKVILVNFSNCDFKIQRGMRIAQMVIAPVLQVLLMDVDVLPKTARGEDGFGSTGTAT